MAQQRAADGPLPSRLIFLFPRRRAARTLLLLSGAVPRARQPSPSPLPPAISPTLTEPDPPPLPAVFHHHLRPAVSPPRRRATCAPTTIAGTQRAEPPGIRQANHRKLDPVQDGMTRVLA
ncbi:unnamed protein product [Urochloa humidicola]